MGNIGVYKIELNNKTYVGSTTKGFNDRWYKHLKKLRKGIHENPRLQNAFNKYGEMGLIFSILEIVKTPEECIIVEQKYIDELIPEYNICRTAGNRLGVKHSDETKTKIGAKSRGNRNCLGRKASEETLLKMSKVQIGHKHTDEAKLKIGAAAIGNKYGLGYKHTDNAKEKMSISRMGNKNSLGHKPSEETRLKMSESHKNRYKMLKEVKAI